MKVRILIYFPKMKRIICGSRRKIKFLTCSGRRIMFRSVSKMFKKISATFITS